MEDIEKQYKKVKDLLGDNDVLQLKDEDALRYQDILELLEERGYVRNINADDEFLYFKTAKWDGFEDWLKAEIKASKRMSRREWRIAIVSAVIGAAIGLIPYIVSLFQVA